MADPHVLIFGSSLDARGATALRSASPAACAGLAVGAESMNPKQWACEDSVLLARVSDGGWLAAVADAHFGGLSGEVVVRSALGSWHQARATEPSDRMRQALFAIDGELPARGSDSSETTALIVHLQGRSLTWANVGDSVLWVLGAGGVQEKNQPKLQFVGRRALSSLPSVPEANSAQLAPGDVVLLATDGILERTSDLDPAGVAARLRRPEALERRVEGLLRHMSEVGRDNLGVVAIEVA